MHDQWYALTLEGGAGHMCQEGLSLGLKLMIQSEPRVPWLLGMHQHRQCQCRSTVSCLPENSERPSEGCEACSCSQDSH